MKGFRRTLFFSIGTILLLVITACSSGNPATTDVDNSGNTDQATPEEKFELRLGTVVNPPHPWVEMGDFFAKEVEKRTDGNVTVAIHHSSTLGDDEAIIDELQLGTVDFIIGSLQNAAPYVEQFQIFGLSYLFKDMEQFEKAIEPNSEITNRFKEFYGEAGLDLKLLGLSGGGTRNVSHKSKEITKASDLEGVKMRLPGSPIESKLWSALGAVPTSLPWNEVYSGVQTGVVDSFESTLSGYEGSKLYEVAPNVALTEHLNMASHFTMSGLTEEKLPDEYNQIIEEVAIEASYLGTEKGKEFDQTILTELKEQGVTFSEVDKASFSEKLKPLHDELAEEIGATDLLEMIRNIE